MKRRNFLQLTIAALASLPAHAAPGAGDLLRSMAGAQNSLSYSGTMQITRPAAASITIQIWRAGEKQRLEWTAPALMRGDVLVDDGQSVWHYHRAENSAIQTRGTAEIDWNRLSRSMDASLAGSGDVAGRAAWIVALTPRGGDTQPGWKVWIDQKNLARLRVERLGASGQTMALQDVSFAPVPSPGSTYMTSFWSLVSVNVDTCVASKGSGVPFEAAHTLKKSPRVNVRAFGDSM